MEIDAFFSNRLVAWVTHKVLPHEGKVRAWLSRSRLASHDIDDVVQEAYCRLASLSDPDAIERPDAYFFSIARNLLLSRMRRQAIVQIEAMADLENFYPVDETPSPERTASAKSEIDRIREIVALLPERCRTIFELRKIEGLSQRAIAERLGVSESIVENDAAKGVRLVLAALKHSEDLNSLRLDRPMAWPGDAA